MRYEIITCNTSDDLQYTVIINIINTLYILHRLIHIFKCTITISNILHTLTHTRARAH